MKKCCNNCNINKDINKFYKRKLDNGYNSWCIACCNEYGRKYKKENKERVSKKNKKYRDLHKNELNLWRRKNKDRVLVHKKTYRKNHKEDILTYCRNYKARKRNAMGSHNLEDINNLYIKQNKRCYYCNKMLRRKFHVDHKIPLCRNGSNDVNNLCCSCKQCNLRKGTKTEQQFRHV